MAKMMRKKSLEIQILAGNTLMSSFHVSFEIELPLVLSTYYLYWIFDDKFWFAAKFSLQVKRMKNMEIKSQNFIIELEFFLHGIGKKWLLPTYRINVWYIIAIVYNFNTLQVL